MERRIVTHLIAAAVATVLYTCLTHDDAGYIMAMVALYCWVLVVTEIAIDSVKEHRRKNAIKNKTRR